MAGNLGLPSDWYRSALGREGDQQGLDYWNQQLAGGANPADVRQQFTQGAARELNGAQSNPYEDARVNLGMGAAMNSGQSWQDFNKSVNPNSYNQSIGERYAEPQNPYTAPSGNSPASSGGGGQNPYLADMGKAITQQVNDNWTRVQAPSIRSGAMQSGNFGGSRQGVVEANALKDINTGLSGALANLYGTDWTNQQQRNLQQRNMDQSYDLGLRGNDLGFANLDLGINQANFNNNLAGANLGRDVWRDQMAANNLGIGAATNIQNTPMDYFNNFSQSAYRAGGLGGTGEDKKTNNGSWLNTALGFGSLFL